MPVESLTPRIGADQIRAALACGRPGCPCGHRGKRTHCPAHRPDRDPSFDVAERDGKVLVVCRAGCRQLEVIEALRAGGLWPERALSSRPSRPRSALDEARALALAELTRQRRRLEPWRDIMLAADHVRLGHLAARLARERATALGDCPEAWRLADLAAQVEREGRALEAALDEGGISS